MRVEWHLHLLVKCQLFISKQTKQVYFSLVVAVCVVNQWNGCLWLWVFIIHSNERIWLEKKAQTTDVVSYLFSIVSVCYISSLPLHIADTFCLSKSHINSITSGGGARTFKKIALFIGFHIKDQTRACFVLSVKCTSVFAVFTLNQRQIPLSELSERRVYSINAFMPWVNKH